MGVSKFSFLQNNYPELFLISELSENLYYVDPSSSLAKLRLFSEKMTILIWKFEDLGIFDGNQVDRINQLYYKNSIPEVVKYLLHTVRKSGNKASHDGSGTNSEALFILKKCFQLARWFYETYENDFLEKEDYILPDNNHKNTLDDLNAKLEKLSKEVIDYQTKVASFNATPEIISKRKEKSNRNANNIHLDEADTRTILIDKQLVAAGWECDSLTINYKNNKTVPEKGKNKVIAEWPCQGKWADYALFVGLELYGIVEAKKYATDISTDLHQSKVYAERLELASHFKLNALHNYQYFDLKHNGIVFKQFVGVIQVDGLTIEILPKIDNDGKSEAVWQKVLIEMLRVKRKLKVQKVGNANVNKQSIHLLDIYFEWFLNEVQTLIHQGLIKQYYKETSNVKSLKGKLEFAGHISKNLVHKERFYTTHQVYDKDHLIHQILFKALDIVERCSKGSYLYSKCKTVQLDFPEVKAISVTETTFSKISSNRKTAPYETALAISKFIILNFAPNISIGSENMLALLFDMNSLWEEYILARLKQTDAEISVYGQQSTTFWNGITIRPDIVIKKGNETFIIDTKWKKIKGGKPSTDDLRQMYVYNDYWKSDKAMLLYPSNQSEFRGFVAFEKNSSKVNQHKCGLGTISIFNEDNNRLNESIGGKIIKWFKD